MQNGRLGKRHLLKKSPTRWWGSSYPWADAPQPAISLAIAVETSLAQAQAMARHSKPNTTIKYFHNWNRIKDEAERCVIL